MKDGIIVTVFTPTYNRMKTLERLYSSLLMQDSMCFEWLIVDDGSIDKTEEYCKTIAKKCKSFAIRYYKQPNQGKHVAINYGVKLANGRLFFIVDSDDYLLEDAISSIIGWEKTIDDCQEFAGVAGNKGFSKSDLIGKTFECEYVDATSLERKNYSIYGDKAEVFYTDILRKYPFPVFVDEKFMTENVVWYRIASDNYKIRWFNEIIYIAEYRTDGLTSNQYKILAENPKGYALSVLQDIQFLNYNIKQAQQAYFDYYQIVRSKVSLKKAANYLNVSSIKLVFVIYRIYFQAFKRKIFKNMKVIRKGVDRK